jgi:uncharacterized protein
MVKLIILGIIGYVIYRLFWNKKITNTNTNFDENDLIECSNCHTFVPKNECKFTQNGCLCKDCQ